MVCRLHQSKLAAKIVFTLTQNLYVGIRVSVEKSSLSRFKDNRKRLSCTNFFHHAFLKLFLNSTPKGP